MIPFLYTVAVDCGDLTDLTDGAVNTSSGTTFNMNATYSCDFGYNLNGTNTRTCQAGRMWSGSEPTCDSTLSSLVHLCTLMVLFLSAVVTCPALSDPTNGMVDVPSNNFGSIATYACGTGYTLNGGSTTRTCGSDGMWSDSDPTCTRKLDNLSHTQCSRGLWLSL